MIKGYKEGMISLYDICEVAMLHEPCNPKKVFNEFLESVNKSENEEQYNQHCNNLKYLMSLSRCILSNKDEDTNFAVRFYLSDFIKYNFDADYSYNWHELKSILFYCNYMSKLKIFKNFADNLKNSFLNFRLCAYLIEDSALPERKIIAQKYQTKACGEKMKRCA